VSDETRPNPDTLLAAIQKEDARKKRGKLKVFFGMAPGVAVLSKEKNLKPSAT
jgi:two-component system sensor histidine kinase KdpD